MGSIQRLACRLIASMHCHKCAIRYICESYYRPKAIAIQASRATLGEPWHWAHFQLPDGLLESLSSRVGV